MGSASFPAGCDLRYSVANSKVGSAAAEVAGESAAKLLGGGVRMLVKESLGRDYISGRAEAALLRVVINICLLHRMRLIARHQALGGCDLIALRFDGEAGARVHRSAIEQHCASATLAAITDTLRPGHIELLAQSVKQGNARLKLRV